MYITYVLIGITTLVSLYAFKSPALLSSLMMNPYYTARNQQYYRFVSSGFVHKDHVHLLWNMFSFYFFGTSIEREFQTMFGQSGGLYFIALYILAIIVSDVPTYFKHRNNPGYNSLGASGGVSAVIFAYIIFEPLSTFVSTSPCACLALFSAGCTSFFPGTRGAKRTTTSITTHTFTGRFLDLYSVSWWHPPRSETFLNS